METFSELKNKISEYRKEIDILKTKVNDETYNLIQNIIDYWSKTHFITTKSKEGYRDYYYLYSFDLSNLYCFSGVKISDCGEILVATMPFNYVLNSLEYESISAERFFAKLKLSKIELECEKKKILNKKHKIGFISVHRHELGEDILDSLINYIKQ